MVGPIGEKFLQKPMEIALYVCVFLWIYISFIFDLIVAKYLLSSFKYLLAVIISYPERAILYLSFENACYINYTVNCKLVTRLLVILPIGILESSSVNTTTSRMRSLRSRSDVLPILSRMVALNLAHAQMRGLAQRSARTLTHVSFYFYELLSV